MAREIHRLKNDDVASLKDGRHCDGAGLYLAVDGTRRSKPGMGLGSTATTTLTQARKAAAEVREKVRNSRDPAGERAAEKAAKAAAKSAPEIMTFNRAARAFIESRQGAWRNKKHRMQWPTTLNAYCGPLLQMPVETIKVADVHAVIKPIWQSKQETASRVLGRVKLVLDFATAKGYRSGNNPARWDIFQHLLAPRAKSRPHHAALAFQAMPAFMGQLREIDGNAARALELVALTAVRSGEAIGAQRSEFDLETSTWTIPASRMKGKKEPHIVPLSSAALAIVVDQMKQSSGSAFLFPGIKAKSPVSQTSLRNIMRQLAPEATIHGLRSSFRDYAGDCTDAAPETAEAALAHAVGNAVEAAYRRNTALEKRRQLMQSWSDFILPPAA